VNSRLDNLEKSSAGRDRMVVAYSRLVIRSRWAVILLALLGVIAAASGAQRLAVDDDIRRMFSSGNPHLLAFEELEAEFTKVEGITFVVAPKDGDVFTHQTLAAIEDITRDSWQIPYSSRVDSITNFQHTRADGDDLVVTDLVNNAAALTPDEADAIRAIALSEPLLVNRLVSERGHVTGVNVNVILPRQSLTETPTVAHYAEEMAETFRQKYPDIDLYLTGVTMMNAAFGDAALKDMSTLFPLMILVLMIVMGVLLRSAWGTFTAMVVVMSAAATAMGFAGWIGIDITAPMANAPTIILALALADSVHILTTTFHQMRLGASKSDAIIESLRVNFQPVFLTSLTTAIGFLALNFADAPPFRDLGNVIAVGVAAAFIFSVFFLPALLAVVPLRTKKKVKRENALVDQVANFVVKRKASLFWGMLTVMFALFAAVPLNELNDVFIEYFDESYAVRRATDFAEENLTGFQTIEYSLSAGAPGDANEPEYLRQVEEFADWYRMQPGVVHVSTITDTFKRLNKNMHGDDNAYYRLPERRDMAAQYLLLYEMSLPYGLDLNNQVNIDKSATRMTVSSRGWSAKDLRKTDAAAHAWLQANAPASMVTYGASMSIMMAFTSEANINAMLGGVILALVLVSGILVIALRSVKLGLISLVPNLAPVFMAFGIWGLYFGQVGVGVAIVGTMAFGIVVDDTVHFLTKYLRARRESNMNAEDAVRYSFHTVGAALLSTTIILVAGFMVLTLSGFRVNSDLGLLTALAIISALVLDFLFLPVLLMRVDKNPPIPS
jgi:uncharacterized protein